MMLIVLESKIVNEVGNKMVNEVFGIMFWKVRL